MNEETESVTNGNNLHLLYGMDDVKGNKRRDSACLVQSIFDAHLHPLTSFNVILNLKETRNV